MASKKSHPKPNPQEEPAAQEQAAVAGVAEDEARDEKQRGPAAGSLDSISEGEQGVAPLKDSGVDEALGTEEDSSDADPEAAEQTAGDSEEFVETFYEPTATGHRVIRRVVRRTSKTETSEEDLTETITEDYPVVGYQAPASTAHPAPVG